MSQSKISKIETGRVLPTALDVERILGAIGVEQALREELTVLARLAAVEYRTWRSYRRTGMHHKR